MGYLKKQSRSKNTGNNIFWSEVFSMLNGCEEGKELLDEEKYTRSNKNLDGVDETYANYGAFLYKDALDTDSYKIAEFYDYEDNETGKIKSAVFTVKIKFDEETDKCYMQMRPELSFYDGSGKDICDSFQYDGLYISNANNPSQFLRKMKTIRALES